MKTIQVLVLASTLLLSASCAKDKDTLLSSLEIPAWLREQIKEHEQIIDADPKRMQNFGAWIRYKFKGEYYYEYDNLLSSLSRNPYSEDGTRIDVTQPPYTSYWNKKCCEKCIWKAPKYIE